MYAIIQFSMSMKRTVKTGFETLEAAMAYARINFDILHSTDDEEHDAADFITHGMEVYAVQKESGN